MKLFILSTFISYLLIHVQSASEDAGGMIVFTVATEPTDGFLRFMKAAERFGHTVKVLGMGETWKGGDVAREAGGGHKVNLLLEAMKEYKDQTERMIMFVDSYDLVITASEKDILEQFKKFSSNVIFSAEDFCWPDPNLEKSYPPVKPTEYRFLNSGGFMGYAPQIYEILTTAPIKNRDDDQLFYTNVFLDKTKREKLKIKLDTRAEIFQCLHGALDEVKIKFKSEHSYLYNTRTGSSPLVLHGNGPIKADFNGITNYLPDEWTPTTGCRTCQVDNISLADVPKEDFPVVLLTLFIERPTPFVGLFLDGVSGVDYPKDRMHVYLLNTQNIHEADVKAWLDVWQDKYASVKTLHPDNPLNMPQSRNAALEECIKLNCDYIFNVDGETQLTQAKTLKHLIQTNKTIIAPMMIRPGKAWSTFWGALSREGFYKRSQDYVNIISDERRGIWNVPHIAYTYVIHGSLVPKLKGHFIFGDLDSDMAFSRHNREKGIFMYVDNQISYGYLSYPDGYPTAYVHNDLWAVKTNKESWERMYLHPDYWTAREEGTEVEEPCPDVYRLPFVKEIFADHLIGVAEKANMWSDGTNNDPRLAGGYENVPTVDTHMNQIGWEQEWLHILAEYVAPMANKVYKGYTSEARATMNFLVRYRPGEQDRLRPHQDTSTYSLNIALNRPKIDFEGGGTRFLRYNCTASNFKGGMVMHPGRLTHQHEGIKTTRGTRYIMVCFVDP